MSISMIGSFLSGVSATGGTAQARQNSPTATVARSDMDEIREKGLTAWAHDKKMEALRQRIRDQVLKELGANKDGVAAPPDAQDASVENEIAKLVEERLQQTMQASVKEAAASGKSEAVLLNIMV